MPPPKKISLHDLSREPPSDDEVETLVASLATMEARAAALIVASILDNHLENAIAACFVKLSVAKFDALFRDRQAPFGSFSNKISVAYALGAYDDTVKGHLDRVRTIRNAFAHTMQAVDFDHPVIAAECNLLDPSKISRQPFAASTPRERFIGSATLIGIVIVSFTRDRLLAAKTGEVATPTAYTCKFESQPVPETLSPD